MKQREMGPLVMFILKPSLGRKLTDLKLELAALEKNNALSTEARMKRLAEVRSEIAPLEERARQPLEGAADKRDVAFSFIVIPDCGAVQSMAIFVAAILAFPAGWFRRLIGMVVGIPVLYLVNAFRLAFLAVIGAMDNGGEWFKFAHEYVWQGIYIVFVVALWMGWVEFVVRRRSS